MEVLSRSIPRWISTAFVAGAILYATLASHPVGAESLPLIPGIDKAVHFIMFALLTAALLFDVGRTEKAMPARRVMALSGMASILFGAVDELLQEWIAVSRTGDPIDWLADLVGTAAVLVIFAAWRRLRRHGARRSACRG